MDSEAHGNPPARQDAPFAGDVGESAESTGFLGSARTAARAVFPRRHPSRLVTVLVLLVAGTFVASCPIPRKLPQWLRLVLLIFAASLTAAPPLRNGRLQPVQILWRRLCIAYMGLAVSTFSLFSMAEEVHLELRWTSVFGYQSPSGLRLGCLSRCALVLIGFTMQKASRMWLTWRILAVYLLCMVWVYIDVPLTLLSLASGREHW